MKRCIKMATLLGLLVYSLVHVSSMHADGYGCSATTIDIKKVISSVLVLFQKYEHQVVVEELEQCLLMLENPHDVVKDELLINKLTAVKNKIEQLCKAPRPDAANVPAIVGPLVECDVELALGLLNQIIGILVQCCNTFQQDFIFTFSFISELITTITECCDAIENSFNGTFTVLTEINNTLTTCCAAIENEFDNTFTLLSAEFNGTSTALADLESTLTICCDNIQSNFNATFTIIASLSTTVTCPPPPPCSPTPITAPTTITASGFYCLATDIAGSIVITADNVTLDLNDHTMTGAGSGTGITVGSGVNRIVRNGSIINFGTAINCTDNTDTIIENITIIDSTTEGVTVVTSTLITIDSVNASGVSGIGFHFTGPIQGTIIKNSTVTLSQQGFIFSNNVESVIMENCHVLDCSSAINTLNFIGGILFSNNCFGIQLDNCSVKGYVGLNIIVAFAFTDSEFITVRNCTAQDISATGPSSEVGGFSVLRTTGGHDGVTLINCIASNITGPFVVAGFEADETVIVYDGCTAQFVTGVIEGDGFRAIGDAIQLTNCFAYDCSNIGFNYSDVDTRASFEYCQAAYNDIGFFITSTQTVVGNCVAFSNTGTGFDLTVSGNSDIYFCFASQNGFDYANAVNVQNANTQIDNAVVGLTGPFAGANLFM